MKNILLLIIAVFTSLQIQAQQKEIKGTITDEDNLPLPGVNVNVKGTANGTTTDFDGNYSIETNTGDILIFSYVGQVIEETVGAENNISFIMKVEYEEEVIMGCFFGRSRIADHITYQYVEVKLN